MARTTRDDILQLHAQADNDLDRYLGNLQKLEAIYVKANEEFDGRYDLFFLSIQNFAVIAIKLQQQWQELRNEKL